jgi:hypothetical protein
MRKTVGAVAVAAAIAGVGGAAIAAAADGGFHAMSGGMHGPGPAGPPPPPAHRTDDEPDTLHGEYVVADGHGGYSTLISQTGRVTAISATSVTARSEDGFVQTYVVHEADGTAKPPFAVDEMVTIDATRSGSTATVTSIRPPLSPGH